MDFSKLSKGIARRPLKIVLTGVEGVGKTTFAANAPKPIFADLERGSSTFDVTRFPEVETWDQLLDCLTYLYETGHADYETFVIDSLSVAERFAGQKVARQNNVDSVEEVPYGKGHGMVGDEFDSLLRGCDALVNKGMNVILVCHSVIRRFDDPAGDSYDTYDIALSKRTAPRVKQWGDTILFADHDKSTVQKGEGFHKRTVAKSYGDRIMFTEHRATHVAKNRFGLPEKMPLDWHEFAKHIDDFYSRGK